jgi:hypothetical protein
VANSFYLDASALAKRYVPETGSAQVDAILDAKPVRPVTNRLARPLIVAHSINSADAVRVPVWSGPGSSATLAKD